MENITHNGFMWHLRMVGMRIIDRIIFTLAYICCERLSTVRNIWVVWLTVVLNKVTDERIRTGCIVWGIGKCQDILVITNRETFNFTELRIPKLLSQDFQEVRSAG